MNATFILLAATLALPSVKPASRSAEISGGPYCGIYCVYAVSVIFGQPLAIEKLLENKFVGSYKGSTVGQLIKATEEAGLYASPVTELSLAHLQASENPIILHVRRPGHKMPYAHWVLYTGMKDGQALLLDPPGGVESFDFAELAALWDGNGIVVSREPLSIATLDLVTWKQYLPLMTICGTGVLLTFAGRNRLARKNVYAMALLAFLACGIGVIYQTVHPWGIYKNPPACGLVAGQHFDAPIPIIDAVRLKELMTLSTTRLVDARLPEDYKRGHLPGAVSVPISSGFQERNAFASSHSKDNTIVVYCQSEGCVWADSVAADLYFRGFKKLVIFRGGWHDWAEKQ
jgi:rhodanese-related sulfurtransferase